MLKQILITGSVTSAGHDNAPLYKELVSLCKSYANLVYSPLDTINFRGSDKERYQRAIKIVGSTDLMIAEMTVPSTGQGIELQEAFHKKVPVIVLASKYSKVSGLVLGAPNVKNVVYYENMRGLKETLKDILDDITADK